MFLGFGSVQGLPPNSGLVRQSFVFDGLTIARDPRFATGISAAATFELNGPTIPRILLSLSICWTFCVPFCGSCAPLTVSSKPFQVSLNPFSVPVDSTANWTPFWVGMPSDASAPETGRSLAMMISPLLVPALGAPPPVPPVEQAEARIDPAANAVSSQRFCIDTSSSFAGADGSAASHSVLYTLRAVRLRTARRVGREGKSAGQGRQKPKDRPRGRGAIVGPGRPRSYLREVM